MKFAQNNHPTRLFGPTLLFGTWEYFISNMNFRHYELFQESRRICNAIYTHIIYSEYIPAIIGTEFAAAYDLLPRNLDQEKSDRKVRILKLFRRLKSRPFDSLSGTLGSLANHNIER